MSHAQLNPAAAGTGRRTRSHRSRWRSRTRLGASLAASALALAGAGTANAAAGTPTVVSYTAPSRMVESTGNLYWTWNETPNQSFVFRDAKTGVPGQEIELASVSGVSLGDIAYAQVGGTWFGYVVANKAGSSQILRVPLTASPNPAITAVVLKNSLTPIGQRDLVTDGTNLYWADSSGLREMPIAGGTVKSLATGANFGHLVLDPKNVIYTAGQRIMIVSKTVPTSGMPFSGSVTSAPYGVSISALSVLIDGSTDEFAYGETNGSVYNLSASPLGWGRPQIDAPPRPGVTVTTVAVTGPVEPSAEWGECTSAGCDLNTGDGNVTTVAGSPIDLQTDGGEVFWGGSALYSMAIPPVIS